MIPFAGFKPEILSVPLLDPCVRSPFFRNRTFGPPMPSWSFRTDRRPIPDRPLALDLQRGPRDLYKTHRRR